LVWHEGVDNTDEGCGDIVDPYLQGNNAPVHEEIDVANLPVDGELPPDLEGIYMRNKPNPAFDPISYTYLCIETQLYIA
jgi:carotenoid cleavage dioxygenase-like enzyme